MTPGGIDCNVLNGGTLYASQLQFLWQGRWCHWRFLCSVPNPSHSNNNNNNNNNKTIVLLALSPSCRPQLRVRRCSLLQFRVGVPRRASVEPVFRLLLIAGSARWPEGSWRFGSTRSRCGPPAPCQPTVAVAFSIGIAAVGHACNPLPPAPGGANEKSSPARRADAAFSAASESRKAIRHSGLGSLFCFSRDYGAVGPLCLGASVLPPAAMV